MPFRFKLLFGQPRMCKGVSDPHVEQEERDVFQKKFHKTCPVFAWDRESLLKEGTLSKNELEQNALQNDRVILSSPLQESEGAPIPQQGVLRRIRFSQAFEASYLSLFGKKESMEDQPEPQNSASNRRNLTLPIPSRNMSPLDPINGWDESLPAAHLVNSSKRCRKVFDWQRPSHFFSVSDNLGLHQQVSDSSVAARLSGAIVSPSPVGSAFTHLTNSELQNPVLPSTEPLNILSSDHTRKSSISSSTSALDESPPSSSNECDKDPFMQIKNGSLRNEECHRLPFDVELRHRTEPAVRRSSIKSSTSKRRSRHSSGHSVTFDLPEVCDNHCLPQNNLSEAVHKLLENGGDEGHSKPVQVKSNESIKMAPECHSNLKIMGCCNYESNLSARKEENFWTGVEKQNIALQEEPLKQNLFKCQRSIGAQSQQQSNFTRKSAEFDDHLPKFLSLEENPTYSSPSAGPNTSPSDTNDPTSRLPNSWGVLLPPLRVAANSIDWSSTESSSESSDHRGPDSGYWGLLTKKEGGGNESFREGPVDIGCVDERKIASRKYRMTRRGGVKVVTQGTHYFLPYAYLEEGRIKLNIVRDEVLEETGCALTVRDVSELLHAQYAIITGGKSRDNCPIITFPDQGNFHQLSDEEYRKLIIYLTSVPSLQEADLGFVLVIDRRTDKWNSVKTVLLKISGFFPGLITVAYVLRPGGFLQKAISEVSSKIFRDEFKFKVVVCNCIFDLHTVIDKNQLTEGLEGCIPYNHEEWIEQRVAVEKFSANTQEISGSLRAFTQSLQETEFPNDVCSCEELLRAQTADYGDLKEDLLSASHHGEALLNCIKRPGEPRNLQLCPDKLINVTAVERLLVQLEETEKTFDDFWTRHESRLTQCLQLRRFEADFKELQPVLEDSIKELSLMTEAGDSVARVDELIGLTQEFHQNCADQLEKAEELRSMGSHFIENDHYAVDSIQPKCVELIRMRETFHDLMTKRLHKLHKCRDMQAQIEKINNWCTSGVALLASQQMERFQTPEQAEEALKELELFLSSCDDCNPGAAKEMRVLFEDVITPESKALVQQVLKRLDDVHMMCEKKKSSLKKLSSRLPRPIHAVTPEPAIPFHHVLPSPSTSLGHAPMHSHPASPLHHHSCGDLTKSPKSLRKTSTLSKLETDFDSTDCLPDPEAAKAKRGHVLKELLETERIYVEELCSILKGYKDEMMNAELQPQIPINLYGKADILFGNMEEIFRFHNDIFLRDLENCINTPELIGLCFVQRKDTFHHLYSLYCQNKPQSEELRRQVGDCNLFFKECQRRLGHKLPLGAYLLKPVQRITKYQLLLKDLLKCVEGTQGRRELQEAVDTMLTVLKCLNDSMHQVAITGYPGSLSEFGRLLMQGPFCVWNESKKGLRELRLKPAQRHLFLYEKSLLFTKRAGKDTDRETYHFKNALSMSQIGLTENVKGNKGDMKKFEVWLQGRQEVYTILASSLEVKETWVKEIKIVLFDQFEQMKGENIKQYSARIQKGASLNGMRIPPLSPTAQHRALRQTASWDVAGGSSVSSSSSDSVKAGIEGGRESSSRRSKTSKSSDATSLGDAPEEEEESWSSEYSPSDEEEDHETFSENTEFASSRFLVLADYNAMGSSEVSLREGDTVDLIKVGCAGWWYVRVSGAQFEGWAPAAYLERVLKKNNRSSPSVSSQESTSGIRPATSRSSVVSLTNKSEDVP